MPDPNPNPDWNLEPNPEPNPDSNPEPNPEPDPNIVPDPWVSGSDLRIRTKISRIYSTMMIWIQLYWFGSADPDQNILDPEPDPNIDPDLWASGSDLRIRAKISRIYSTMMIWIQLQ